LSGKARSLTAEDGETQRTAEETTRLRELDSDQKDQENKGQGQGQKDRGPEDPSTPDPSGRKSFGLPRTSAKCQAQELVLCVFLCVSLRLRVLCGNAFLDLDPTAYRQINILIVMFDLLAFGEEDRVLTDVRREIGDTLQVPADQQQFQ
jgi:hypothetical protein